MLLNASHLKALRNTVVVTLACAVLALSQATNMYAFFRGERAWSSVLAITFPPWLIMATLAPALSSLARSFSFAPRQVARSAVIHAVASIAFSLAHVALVGAAFTLAIHEPTWALLTRNARIAFNYLFYQDVLAYGVVVGMCMTLYHSSLRTRLAEARLTALRAQLNPHFLFNTLNAVTSLSLTGRHKDVAQIVGRLGGLLRVTLDGQAQEISLSSEMNFVDDYLAIQGIRFGDRLSVRKDIEPGTLDAIVPSLLLQPIIENAIEHGIGRDVAAMRLTIRASRDHDSLLLEVEDTGCGFPDTDPVERIGLSNTRERLRELYGADSRFEYGNLPAGGAVVRIVFPFHLQTMERSVDVAPSIARAAAH